MIKFYAWALGFANPVHAPLIRAQLSRLEAAVRSLQA